MHRTKAEFGLFDTRNRKPLLLRELLRSVQFYIEAYTGVQLLVNRNFKICFHLFPMSLLVSWGLKKASRVVVWIVWEESHRFSENGFWHRIAGNFVPKPIFLEYNWVNCFIGCNDCVCDKKGWMENEILTHSHLNSQLKFLKINRRLRRIFLR